MKIRELIKILQSAPDKDRDVYIESLGNLLYYLMSFANQNKKNQIAIKNLLIKSVNKLLVTFLSPIL